MPSKIKIDHFPSIYPPRPASAIDPATISRYQGYIAQYKYDDIRLLSYIHPTGRVELLNRKREPILSYHLDSGMKRAFGKLNLTHGKHHLLDGGLLRGTVQAGRPRTIVLWDILIHDDQYLLGTSYCQRYNTLKGICGNPTLQEHESGEEVGLIIAPGLWLAPTFDDRLERRFELTKLADRLEGLMLKNPDGQLDWGVREENNGSWQIRVRKQSGRHVF